MRLQPGLQCTDESDTEHTHITRIAGQHSTYSVSPRKKIKGGGEGGGGHYECFDVSLSILL